MRQSTTVFQSYGRNIASSEEFGEYIETETNYTVINGRKQRITSWAFQWKQIHCAQDGRPHAMDARIAIIWWQVCRLAKGDRLTIHEPARPRFSSTATAQGDVGGFVTAQLNEEWREPNPRLRIALGPLLPMLYRLSYIPQSARLLAG